jgi:hypothetical protein
MEGVGDTGRRETGEGEMRGLDAQSTGVKKSATKNQAATQTAVRPVRPPSRIPEADSMKAAMGEVPMRLPKTLLRPSTQKANFCLGNSFFSFTKPAPAV